jgi:F0F1-type ATP synthase membrane subunit a
MGIFMKPFSLGIRMYLNVLFGYYTLWYVSLFLIKLSFFFFILASPLIFLEICVFVVQSFVFTYLVGMYFEE